MMVTILTLVIICFMSYTTYDDATTSAVVQGRLARYPYFQDVHVMIFVGFGFLMSFLAHAGFTATSHAFLVAVFALLWGILNRAFFARAINPAAVWSYAVLNTDTLIGADCCAGAVLISFGAVLGRITAPQLLVMAFFEVVFYSLNEAILATRLGAADIGGSMVIHTFGAYFGLAFSLALEGRADRKSNSHAANTSSAVTDTMAMVGTLFLFCFWPSFNAAMAQNGQERAVVNTLLSISASAFTAFMVCTFVYGGKFRMVEVQNSTLAGGVAMGAAADMIVSPSGALLAGTVCGVVSVLGYRYLSPLLQRRIGLLDTCGIHNLPGMPGVLGGLVAVVVAASADKKAYGESYLQIFPMGVTPYAQAWSQLTALCVTLAIGATAGYGTGCVCRLMDNLPVFFSDEGEYEGAEAVRPSIRVDASTSQQQYGTMFVK